MDGNGPSTSAPRSPPKFAHHSTLSGHSKAVASVKFSPGEGKLIASASADKGAKIWDWSTGECVRTLQGHSQGLSDVCWNRQGNYLCTASDDFTLRLWDVETGRSLRTLAGHSNYVFCCSFDPHGHLLVRVHACPRNWTRVLCCACTSPLNRARHRGGAPAIVEKTGAGGVLLG